jgi:Domain of unknown function (DUF4383)
MTKTIMYVAGAVFIVLGLLGFVNDPVLGIFDVNALHNIVHIASGVLALIFASQGESQARTFALILGIVYALVTVLGFLTGTGNILGLVATNGADNILHLVLAIVFIIVGLMKPKTGGNSMANGM